jgi:hypothetical protein
MTVRRLTSPTTKVRRLGYIIQIARLLRNSGPLAEIILVGKLERFAQENKRSLDEYFHRNVDYSRWIRETPGGIKIQARYLKHDAARRYIATCRELGLVVRVAGPYQNSKSGNVLAVLDGGPNPFDLSLAQICYLLKTILQRDYDSLKVMADLIKEREADDWKMFQKKLLRRLKDEMGRTSSPFDIQRIKAALNSVESWGSKGKGDSSASRYYTENIKAPRIDWLLDLKVTDLAKKSGRFSRFREFLLSRETIGDSWLADEYYGDFYRVYSDLFKRGGIKSWTDLPEEDRFLYLRRFVAKSYKELGQRELGRLSAIQFLEYSACSLLCTENIIATHYQLKKDTVELFSRPGMDYQIVKTVSGDDEGHIVRL